jgi:hypothetical protein
MGYIIPIIETVEKGAETGDLFGLPGRSGPLLCNLNKDENIYTSERI